MLTAVRGCLAVDAALGLWIGGAWLWGALGCCVLGLALTMGEEETL